VVLTGRYSRDMDLHLTARILPAARYDPRTFSGVIILHNGCTFLLYSNGKFNCLGAKTVTDAVNATESLGKQLITQMVDCRVCNMVMSHCTGHAVDVEGLYSYLTAKGMRPSMEPELFSGITWKAATGGTIRLFHNGKFFVTGLKGEEPLIITCLDVCNVCKMFANKVKRLAKD